MQSCLYVGRVRHRRFEPKPHCFTYPVFYAYLDLDELETVFKGRWLWSAKGPAPVRFRRADYLGDAGVPLSTAVRELVKQETGHAPAGPIRVLTHLRHFGFSFNPVSFYYCFGVSEQEVDTIVAEITNTPWNERHAYVLPSRTSLSQTRDLRFRFEKGFHVSPFMPMDLQYDWAFRRPGENLMVHMKNMRQGRNLFEALLKAERRPINGLSCFRALIGFPFMPVKVIGAIYWQALRLFLKRTPFHVHPSKLAHHNPEGANSANVT